MGSSGVRRLVETTVAAPPLHPLDLSSYANSHLVIIDDGSLLTEYLIRELQRFRIRVILLQPTTITRPAPTVDLSFSDPTQFGSIVHRLHQISGSLAGFLWLHTQPIPLDQQWWSETQPRMLAAIALAQGISITHPVPFFFSVTAQGGRFGKESCGPLDALASGLESLVHPLRMEMPQISFRSIDLDASTPPEEQGRQVLTELSQPDQDFRTLYGWSQGQRIALSLRELPGPSQPPSLRPGAVVVFAGGARGIGAFCAKALAQHTPCQLIFLGRTELSEEILALSHLSPADRKPKEDEFIRTYKAQHPGCSPREPREAWRQCTRGIEAAETLNQIRDLGSEADYFALDVRDPAAVHHVMSQIKERYGRPDILVHVAGLGGAETDRMLSRKEWSVIERVVETKVRGALNLLQICEWMGVPLFIGFGSIASRFGNSGQVDYACANALLAGIVRAHNAKGQYPRARLIGWGAWDEVGMAVSGPTKQMLASQGVGFIAPEVGGQVFVQELAPDLNPCYPAEVYLSPNWADLEKLLQQHDDEPVPTAPVRFPLLGQIVAHQPGEFLKAEREIHPQNLPFLDHHRYQGTSWVPAVLGMEVAVEAATQLHPDLQAFDLRNINLKKAIRLVRDEPAMLLTEVRTQTRLEQSATVQAIVSGSSKGRTWVFAEMTVVLTADPHRIQQRLAEGANYHRGSLERGGETELIQWSHGDLYPHDWLRFQTYGSTFQVLDAVSFAPQQHQASGQLTTTADLSECLLPLTLMDGMFQVYGVTTSWLIHSWSGPPVYFGHLCWQPGATAIHTATVEIDMVPEDTERYPVMSIIAPQGNTIVRLQKVRLGAVGLKDPHINPPPSPPVITTPYLNQITDLETGIKLKAQQTLLPTDDVLLRDHTFNGYVVVPAVYFMELAVEAAASLLTSWPPCEIRDFHIHRMLYTLQRPVILHIEAERDGERQCRVRMLSQHKDKWTLHAEGVVVHGSTPPLECHPIPGVEVDQIRHKADLYPHRFPNGPIFQVIESMNLGKNHTSQSTLQVTSPIKAGSWLPITLLDGAFQVDSATRSGFDHSSGLPKCFRSLRWIPESAIQYSVTCLSLVGNSNTDAPGEIFFLDQDHRLILHLSGIILTPPLPYLR